MYNNKPKRPRASLLMMGAGNILASMGISGFILGYLTDYIFNTSPVFLLGFGLLGFVGGFIRVKDMMIADAKRQQKALLAQKSLKKQ